MKLFQQFFQKRSVRARRSLGTFNRSFENLEPRLAFDVDLSVTISNGQNTYVPGSDKVDTIIVQNSGSDAVTNARVIAPLPDGILSATWAGLGSPGANVPASGSSGNGDALNTLISLPAGGCLLYTSPSPRDLSTSRMPSSA